MKVRDVVSVRPTHAARKSCGIPERKTNREFPFIFMNRESRRNSDVGVIRALCGASHKAERHAAAAGSHACRGTAAPANMPPSMTSSAPVI
jgi:hypothetical protein